MKMPGRGSLATVEMSRITARAKSPVGDIARSVGAEGSGMAVVVPSDSEMTEMAATPSRRTSA